MLILADANGFRVDLDQLSQRILQTTGDAGGAAQAHINVGHFLAGKFAGRIDRRARLAYHYFFDSGVRPSLLGRSRFFHYFHEISSKLVCLTAGGSVANGNQVYAVLFTEPGEHVKRAVPVAARFVRVDGGGFDELPCGIYHRHFDASADAGVQPHDHARAGGRGQQQVAQVVGKNFDGDLLGVFTQTGEQVTLQRQTEFDAPSPCHAFAQQIVGRPRLVAPAQVQRDLALGQRHDRSWLDCCCLRRLGQRRQYQLGVQNLQPAAAENRQCTVRGYAAYRLVVVKIIAEFGSIGLVFILARH